MWALGLMTGTSFDAIDLALVDTDGERIGAFGAAGMHPFHDAERALIQHAVKDALAWGFEGPEPMRSFEQATAAVTAAHLRAVAAFLSEKGVAREDIGVIGFHGQTVLHRPPGNRPGATLQLGDAETLARLSRIDVVHDFRSSDVAAGGHGAPLAPVYHWALAGTSELERPLAVLNLGGVANVTFLTDAAEDLVGFDTGPANGLLDQWVSVHGAGEFDAGGALAQRGTVDEAALAALMDHRHFDLPPPKSLDRYAFSLDPLEGLSLEDGCATLTAFTVETVARAFKFAPEPVCTLVVAGGGARNAAIMGGLARRLEARVVTADEAGWRADCLEAELMAYLAVRHLERLPLTFPGTTGAPKPLTGGTLVKPR